MDCCETTVTLWPLGDYDPAALAAAMSPLLAPFTVGRNLRSAKVLLKPNLITASNGQLACTHGQVMAAVARHLLAQGARVLVGDSPAFGSAQSVLEKIGAWSLLAHLGVEVVEFRPARMLTLPSGLQVPVAAPVLECDYLINLPKLKAHGQMRVTLAVKNYFGCVTGLHKPWWHMVHGGAQGRFAELLVELLTLLPSGYSLVDGIEAMHVSGPIHGQPFALGLLAGGANPIALDTALLAVLGIDPQQSPLWTAARAAGMVGTELGQLRFPHAGPETVQAKGFVVPEELNPVRFNPLRFLKSSVQRLLMRRAE